jgi:putative endonuclease
MNKKKLGKTGECKIADYLTYKGWKILEKNFRHNRKEVDIIARKKSLIIFVEVKTRRNEKFGKGLEAVDVNKRNNIISVARYYLRSKNLMNCNVRFDVASLDGNAVSYIENAFQITGN